MTDQGGGPQPPYGQPGRPGQPGQPGGWGPPPGPGPQYGQPAQPPYGQPAQPPYGQPGQPQYPPPGQPPYGQPGSAQPQYAQPQYGQPQYGQPAQPQYGQPPYGPPPGYGPPGQPPYGPPGRGRGKLPWILGGVGALVVIGVVLALVFTMGGGGSSGPKAVVEHFMAAAKKNDKQTAVKYVCGKVKDSILSGDGGGNNTLQSYTVGDAAIAGDTARVPVKATDSDGTATTTFVLNKQNGKWLICDAETGDTSGNSSNGGGQASATPHGPALSGLPSLTPGVPFCITPPSGGTPICVTPPGR